MNIIAAKKIVTFVMGVTVILVGVALLFLPGPGVAIIVGGLAILATEFLWARRWLRRAQREAVNLGSNIVGEETMKKALGEKFVAKSKEAISESDDTAHESNGSHVANVPDPTPGRAEDDSKEEQDKPGSPTETNQELSAKFSETTAAGRPH